MGCSAGVCVCVWCKMWGNVSVYGNVGNVCGSVWGTMWQWGTPTNHHGWQCVRVCVCVVGRRHGGVKFFLGSSAKLGCENVRVVKDLNGVQSGAVKVQINAQRGMMSSH